MSPNETNSIRPADRREPMPAGSLCANCRYPLEGLPRGGRCPECGSVSMVRAKPGGLARDNLTDAPASYLRRLRAASIGLACFGLLNGMLQGAASVASWGVIAWLMGVAGAGWAVSVHFAACQRPFVAGMRAGPDEEFKRARLLARVTQWAWPAQGVLFSAMLIAKGNASPAATPLWIGARLMQLVGMMGFAPLCVWLAQLADWAQHTSLAGRLRACAVLVGGGGTLFTAAIWASLALGPSPIAAPLNLLALLTFFGYEAGVVLFLVAQLQLAHMAAWAVANASATLERDRRVAERKARRMFTGQAAEGSILAQLGALRGGRALDPCAGCGYDLTGLPPGARCPECGAEPLVRDTTMLVGRPPPRPAPLGDIPLVGDER